MGVAIPRDEARETAVAGPGLTCTPDSFSRYHLQYCTAGKASAEQRSTTLSPSSTCSIFLVDFTFGGPSGKPSEKVGTQNPGSGQDRHPISTPPWSADQVQLTRYIDVSPACGLWEEDAGVDAPVLGAHPAGTQGGGGGSAQSQEPQAAGGTLRPSPPLTCSPSSAPAGCPPAAPPCPASSGGL